MCFDNQYLKTYFFKFPIILILIIRDLMMIIIKFPRVFFVTCYYVLLDRKCINRHFLKVEYNGNNLMISTEFNLKFEISMVKYFQLKIYFSRKLKKLFYLNIHFCRIKDWFQNILAIIESRFHVFFCENSLFWKKGPYFIFADQA